MLGKTEPIDTIIDAESEKRKRFCQTILPIKVDHFEQNGKVQNYEYFDPKSMGERIQNLKKYANEYLKNKPKATKSVTDIKQDSFILGEAHSQLSPKRFLIENMAKLKANNFKIMFIEHFYYDTDQSDLDYFFKTGVLTKNLKKRINEVSRHGDINVIGKDTEISSELYKKYNFYQVLLAAREAGIRIVGIDVSHTYQSQRLGIGGRQRDDTRIPYMNYTAYHIMKRETSLLDPNDKWFGYMGEAHVHSFEGMPGIADLLDVRSVYVYDAPDWKDMPNQKAVVQYNVNFTREEDKQKFTLHGDINIRESPTQPAISVYSTAEEAMIRNHVQEFETFVTDLKNCIPAKSKHWKAYFENDFVRNPTKAKPKELKMALLAEKIQSIRKDVANSAQLSMKEIKEILKPYFDEVIKAADKQQAHKIGFLEVKFQKSDLSKALIQFMKDKKFEAVRDDKLSPKL